MAAEISWHLLSESHVSKAGGESSFPPQDMVTIKKNGPCLSISIHVFPFFRHDLRITDPYFLGKI